MIDIDKLESLPKRESISRSLVRRCGTLWESKKYEYRYFVRNDRHRYYIVADRIITKWVGRDVDGAYSEFLSKAGGNVRAREAFKSKFKKIWWGSYRGWYADFSIVDDKIVDARKVLFPKKKFPKTVKSGYEKTFDKPCKEYYQMLADKRKKHSVKVKDYNLSIPKIRRKRRWLWSTFIFNRTVDELITTNPNRYYRQFEWK